MLSQSSVKEILGVQDFVLDFFFPLTAHWQGPDLFHVGAQKCEAHGRSEIDWGLKDDISSSAHLQTLVFMPEAARSCIDVEAGGGLGTWRSRDGV